MSTGRTYTVIGAGAVGLLYGAHLATAGHRVRWLVRSGAEAMCTTGIEVTTPTGTLRIAAEADLATSDPSRIPAADVVLVATKATANDRLCELVASVCVDGATVVVLQNGLGAEERIRTEVPAAGAVVGGLCFVCAHRVAPGRADHLDYGAVTLAGLDPASAAGAAAVAHDLGAAGVETALLHDLGVARWRKLVWNIPFNGLSVVLDAGTDALLADPGTRALLARLMDEVIAAARACGSPIDPTFRDEMLAATDAMTPYAPSMQLDHRAGRPLEREAIYEIPLARAVAAGAPMPTVRALADLVAFRDRAGRVPSAHG